MPLWKWEEIQAVLRTAVLNEEVDMALVRCESHGRPEGRTQTYVKAVRPVGYPDTAAICGAKDCNRSGLVWLNEDEKNAYDRGERVFSVPTAAVKIKVV